MAVRRLYETAFDSTASPADVDQDPADILETSRRLFSPEPASTMRPSPASSRSSSDSDRSRRGTARSPGLPLKKIFSPWTCGKDPKGSDTPLESHPPQTEPKEEKSKTFSPSVEFKKLDVADENKNHTMDSILATFSANPARASSEAPSNENGPSREPSLPLPMPSTFNSQKKPELSLGGMFPSQIRDFENGDCSSTTTTFVPSRASREDMKRSNFNDNAISRNNLWLDFSRAPKRPRRHLCLDINNMTDGEELEPTAQLMKQGWYHGSISRADAENLLRLMKKGSFLVRCSEKLKRQYLLSLNMLEYHYRSKDIDSLLCPILEFINSCVVFEDGEQPELLLIQDILGRDVDRVYCFHYTANYKTANFCLEFQRCYAREDSSDAKWEICDKATDTDF